MDARTGGRRAGCAAASYLVLFSTVLIAGSGCRTPGIDTDRLVPRGWRDNPWGPKSNAARLRGTLPNIPNNPDMAAWEDWARTHLRDGDILLRMGDARAAWGLFPFSRVSAAIAGSRYSHSGIVAIEGGAPVVYDTTTTGPQRHPFAVWLLDARGSVAIKRPRPEYQGAAQGALAFCRAVYHAQTPFDYEMRLGDDHFYCIEMTERAYQAAGLPLSRPVRLDHLPRFAEFPWTVRLMRLATSMEPQQLAYVIGNESLGIYASPALETVYEAPHSRPPLEAIAARGVGPDTVRR
jgi:hypothetical protein